MPSPLDARSSNRQNLTMRPLIIRVLVGLLIAAIIVTFALFIVIFGHNARAV